MATQRAYADGVISWHYSQYGEALYDSESDPDFAALNSATVNLAECDHDLVPSIRREVEEQEGQSRDTMPEAEEMQ